MDPNTLRRIADLVARLDMRFDALEARRNENDMCDDEDGDFEDLEFLDPVNEPEKHKPKQYPFGDGLHGGAPQHIHGESKRDLFK